MLRFLLAGLPFVVVIGAACAVAHVPIALSLVACGFVVVVVGLVDLAERPSPHRPGSDGGRGVGVGAGDAATFSDPLDHAPFVDFVPTTFWRWFGPVCGAGMLLLAPLDHGFRYDRLVGTGVFVLVFGMPGILRRGQFVRVDTQGLLFYNLLRVRRVRWAQVERFVVADRGWNDGVAYRRPGDRRPRRLNFVRVGSVDQTIEWLERHRCSTSQHRPLTQSHDDRTGVRVEGILLAIAGAIIATVILAPQLYPAVAVPW
jgi:hypothetical protein